MDYTNASRNELNQLFGRNSIENKLDNFTKAYIDLALEWNDDENDCPLSSNYTIDDIAEETLNQIIADCQKFQQAHHQDILSKGESEAGRYFLMTRNDLTPKSPNILRPATFINGNWGDAAERLEATARQFKPIKLYLLDDEKIYLI